MAEQQTLLTLSEILKTEYLPAFQNQLGTEPSPFLEKVKKVPLTHHIIEAAAPVGLNGGFGFGKEGVGTPAPGGQRYANFKLESADMYVDVQISDKSIKLGSNNAGTMLNALDAEIEGSYAAGKWNVGRALYGDGSGVLAQITAADGKQITLDSVKNVIEGLVIDLYPTGASAATTHAARIEAVDRVENTVMLSVDAGVTSGFITVQNSYKNEICGLGSIFKADVTELYGLTKENNRWLNPMTYDAKNDLTDMTIHRAVKDALDQKNSKIDLVMMGDDAFMAYQAYMRDNNVVVVDKMEFQGGAVGYSVLVGNRKVCVVNERFVPETEAWCVDSSVFEFHHTDWNFADQGGSMFTLIPGTSIYRALLTNYGNLMCKNPGGSVRLINCGMA